jgi:hypothetical protein
VHVRHKCTSKTNAYILEVSEQLETTATTTSTTTTSAAAPTSTAAAATTTTTFNIFMLMFGFAAAVHLSSHSGIYVP